MIIEFYTGIKTHKAKILMENNTCKKIKWKWKGKVVIDEACYIVL